MAARKGWVHRYEIEYGEVILFEYTEHVRKAMRWRVCQWMGRGRGRGDRWESGQAVSGAPGDIATADLVRRAGLSSVTVPIVIKRPGVPDEIVERLRPPIADAREGE